MTLTRRNLAVLFGVLLLVFLIATLPLAAALKWSGLAQRGFSARAVNGSVWSGRVVDAAMRDARLGDLKMALSPLALFTGRAKFAFSSAAEAVLVPRGAVGVSSGGIELAGVTASLPLARALPIADAGATLAFQDFNARFADGRCAEAGGGVTADIPIPETLLPGVGSLVLTGNAACEDGRLLLPLTGQTGSGDASLFVHVAASGAYDYDLMVTAGAALQAQLAGAGFAADGGRHRLRGSGRL